MTNSRTYSNTSGSSSHLLEHGWLLWHLLHRSWGSRGSRSGNTRSSPSWCRGRSSSITWGRSRSSITRGSWGSSSGGSSWHFVILESKCGWSIRRASNTKLGKSNADYVTSTDALIQFLLYAIRLSVVFTFCLPADVFTLVRRLQYITSLHSRLG